MAELKFQPSVKTMLVLARDYSKQDDFPMAIDCLYRAHLASKRDSEVMRALGLAYSSIGEFPLAAVWFIRALDAAPKNERIYSSLMQCYIDWGYGMSGAPFYYYTLGIKNGAFKSEEFLNELYDENIGDDFDEESEPVPMKGEAGLRFANMRLTNSMKYEAGKKFYEQEQYNAAYKALKDIPATSDRYSDAQRLLMKIDVYRGHAQSAVDRAEALLQKFPRDVSALIYGAIAYGEKYELKKRDELYARFAAEDKVEEEDDVKKGAALAISLKKYGDAIRYLRTLSRFSPYSRSVLLHLALLNANVGRLAAAKSYIIKVYRLYPDDLTLKYYAQQIDALTGPADFEIIDQLPEEEAKRREKVLDEWLMARSTITAVTAGLKADKTMSEYLDWLFQEGDLDFQGDVAIFLAQSTKWKKYLETLLIDPTVDAGLKKEILSSMFENFSECKVSVTTGQIYQKLNYNAPVGLCELAEKCYRFSFVNLAFVSDGYSRALNKVFVSIHPTLANLEKEETKPDACALAAAIIYRCGVLPHVLKKKECLKLFDCDEKNFNRYTRRLEEAGVEKAKKSSRKNGKEFL